MTVRACTGQQETTETQEVSVNSNIQAAQTPNEHLNSKKIQLINETNPEDNVHVETWDEQK